MIDSYLRIPIFYTWFILKETTRLSSTLHLLFFEVLVFLEFSRTVLLFDYININLSVC